MQAHKTMLQARRIIVSNDQNATNAAMSVATTGGVGSAARSDKRGRLEEGPEEIGTRQATKGINSSFDIVVAKGGGANTNIVSDKNGGCGAGGDAYYPDGGTNGIGLKNSTTNNFPSGTLYSFGNNGGLNGDWGYVGGGGGGVGGVGGVWVVCVALKFR